MNIFSNESNESTVTLIRKTLKVYVDEEGTPVVSFATNKGKGSGAQTMPIDQFADYVATLESYVEEGIPDVASEESLSAAESVRRTIRVESGVISFRVRSGKGAKPAKVGQGEFRETVELLRSTVAAIVEAGKNL